MISRAVHPNRRGRRWLTALAIASLTGGTLLVASAALAVHDEGMQLEGNATASDLSFTDLDLEGSPPKSVAKPGTLSGTLAGEWDWDSLLNISGTPAAGNADGAATAKATGDLPDGFTSADFEKDFLNSGTTFQTADGTTFATGSKDTLDITPGWQCGYSQNVNSKTDIMNGFAAVMEKGSQRFLYFGLDKAKDNGDNNVGMWLLKDPSVGCSAGPNDGNKAFSGHHTVGDLLLVSAFTNGGGVSAITAYEWVADKGDGSPGINPQPVAQSADCLDIGTTGNVDRLCAVINGKPVSMPFLTADNGVINAQHPSPNFWEGGIELTAFPDFADACFNRYILDTRSSQSLTATLFDYVQGSLNTCRPSTTLSKTVSASKIHSGDSVTYTYVDTNDGNRVLSNVSISDDKCSPVTYQSGDSDTDSKLDPGEAWTFTCTTSLTQTTTNTAVAHGFDGLNDVTYCADPQSPPANTICDQDERAQATVTVINPSTSLTLKSQTPASPIYATTQVTIVVTETNTGNDTLTNVNVTGTGCTTWTPAGPLTLAPGVSQDFTCTYTPGASGGWSATGHGTDSLNTPAPSAGETVSGNVVVIHPATTLTTDSQTPPNPVYANTQVTIVVTEKNTGDDTLTGVNITGTGCTTWTAVGQFNGTLAAGASQAFTCSYTPGASGSWSADGHGKDSNGNDVPATNEHTSGTVLVINPSTVLTKNASVNATITYTYTEKNDGDVDLTNPSINDDKCASVVGIDVSPADGFNDGDTNKDGKLSAGPNGAGETWLFKCTVTVDVTSDYSSTNVATGHALDPNNLDITPPYDPDETDTTTVTIHIQ